MADIVTQDNIAGFEAPVHRALTEPILLAGAPRAVAILNGTLSAAIGLGLRLWIAGLVLWAFGHMAAVWAAKRDPLFVEVVRRRVWRRTRRIGSVFRGSYCARIFCHKRSFDTSVCHVCKYQVFASHGQEPGVAAPRPPNAYMIVLCCLLVGICWLKGEPPRWRWGGD
jgi:type IV secretory pathway TrbD component